ncbi:hypothetical protein EGK75_01210 [Neisseria weixii]|uniref:Uncharacterized protein n=1 Tax=Neisseria weixii TaxID=1853276 RepID=A0A3N4NAE2_9NEIS|nr:hypothetical protein [Neisseria weixii]RPD90496.1 hypothetical protein EGK74_01735 [Neisseria weixii]RPD90562.1 hypothetical protein EGK75_01210 [Neisseria weixii]
MSNVKKEKFAEIVEQYKQAKSIQNGIVDVQDLAGWALDQGLYKPNMRDEIQLVASTFSRYFREEHRIDAKGRSYRAKHAVRESVNGKQLTLWADLDDPNVSEEHFRKAFSQRRQQIVGDCVQLKTDVDVCNDKKGSDIPLSLNFEDDVAETEYLRDNPDTAA